MLFLGCSSTNLPRNFRQKYTDAKIYPFNEGDKNLLENIKGVMVEGRFIARTLMMGVDETSFYNQLFDTNHLLGLLLGFCNLTQRVNCCETVFQDLVSYFGEQRDFPSTEQNSFH